MKRKLYNIRSREILEKNLAKENLERITLSFYKYINIKSPDKLRDQIYAEWEDLSVLGRIYISKEGINAQISIPKINLKKFEKTMDKYAFLKKTNIKYAVKEGISFYKLKIKIKNEIVSYGIEDSEYDMSTVGKHLTASEFNNEIEKSDTVVVDIRNNYESEIGHFKGAILPDVERSQEMLPEVKKMLKGKEKNKVLLYCTGGIRCEKASSYLIKNGFTDVNQLKGGIIEYANQMKEKGEKGKFIGKNFVFDERLGEEITSDIISSCHICKEPSNTHRNCSNKFCHILFIQCKTCNNKLDGCCSTKCLNFKNLTNEEKEKEKEKFILYLEKRNKGKIKPRLDEIINN